MKLQNLWNLNFYEFTIVLDEADRKCAFCAVVKENEK